MLAKMTSKNQLTLPKAATNALGSPKYFEVDVQEGRIVLKPVLIVNADAVREKLARLGIAERDIAGAVASARKKGA
ncbi:MAG: AbrB/MazE/SpoVT family DNA-binding domain-containing protein [Firmicutes bacterium]|nr:AbrB/MazE/SpoVT family DNA-binding domain-containing protein [Bacillota bacterium]